MALTAAQLLVRVGADTSQAEAGLQRVGASVSSAAATMAKTGASMSAAFTLPLVAAGAAVFKIGSDFESAFTGVIKTFSGTAAEAEVLRQGIRDMAMELPASAVEIAAVAEAAGALGIAGDNVLSFTRTVIDMAEATDLTADQAANDMARIANIMQMPQTEFERMGSTIVALGNSGASTESEIVSMATRIAGAGAVIGLTEAQVLGWASAMSSVGINAEAGGTAFSRVVVDIAKDVQTGGKNLTKFARIAGVSADKFTKAFEEDASAATLMFIEGLGGIADAGGNVFGVLEELGLSDVRVQDTLLRLAGAGDLVTESLTTANTAWEENLALSREAELRYDTTASKVAILKNRISDLGISLFDTFRPKIDAALDGINAFTQGLGDTIQGFVTANPALVNAALAFAGVLAAAGPVLLLLSGIGAALGFLLSPIGLVVAALAGLASALAFLDTSGVIDLGAVWDTVKTKIQGAMDTFADWREQIATQGLISEESFIATWELPPAAREFMQFVIGLGAAFKTLKAAVTGEDLGAGRIRELTTILESAFGAEIATRIGNIATHITELKEALSGATSVGEWLSSLGDFGKNVGIEVKAIGVEIKKQVEAELIELKIGESLIAALQVQIDKIPWPSLRFDLSAVLTQVKARFIAFATEVKTAWQTAGWAGIGAIVKEQILALGVEIGAAFNQMVGLIQLAAVFAGIALRQAWNTAFVGEQATLFDTTIITTWVQAEIAKIRQKISEFFTVEPTPPTPPTPMPRISDKEVMAAATDFIQSFADAIAGVPWTDYGAQVRAMAMNIGTGIAEAFKPMGFGGAATAIKDGITEGLTGADWSALGKSIANVISAVVRAQVEFLYGLAGRDPRRDFPQLYPDMAAQRLGALTPSTQFLDAIARQMRDISPTRSIIPGRGGSQQFFSPLETFTEDIQLKATITETKPAVGLAPMQIKAMVTATEDATTGKMGDTLTKGAATIGTALAGFSWPDLPDWTWPPYNPFKWSPYPPWQWPPVPAPSWLNRMVVPRPSWLGELLSWSPQVTIRQQAVTTPGQITTASVASAGEGTVGAAGMSGGVTITGDVYVRDELDLEQLAMRITQIQNRRS